MKKGMDVLDSGSLNILEGHHNIFFHMLYMKNNTKHTTKNNRNY